jgi:hypothetical protein
VRSKAILVAYGRDDQERERILLELDDYWDQLHAVLDSAAYRQARGITRVTGELYDSDGRLIERFENLYDEQGAMQDSQAH